MYPYCFEHSISSSSFVASYNICRVISNNLLADISHFHSVVFKEHSGRVHQEKKGVIKTTLHDARIHVYEDGNGLYLSCLWESHYSSTQLYDMYGGEKTKWNHFIRTPPKIFHQWLCQISMKLPCAILRKSVLKFTNGWKRENSILGVVKFFKVPFF